jgi:hypothetical protein
MPNDLTYGDIPPQIQQYLARPGVNKEKAMQWFSLGISEPQTYNQAKLLAEAVGNSPEQAKVVAGQWQFESGGGAHMGANHNYFGIQAHTQAVRDRLIARGINVGVGALTDTPEVRDGKKVNTKNKFMEFDNAFDGFQAHRVFLETNPIYEKALAAPSAKEFALGLQNAGYATAKDYGSNLYNNFVLPKEKSPMSGDKRPSSLGKTVSKVKLGTSTEDQIPEIVPALPTRPIEQIETNTLGIRPEISTSPAQTNYIPTNSAPIVMPASEAMQMGAPKGWFGSGKSTFNAMGGSLNNAGFNALPQEVQNKIRTNMNNKRFAEGGPMGQLTEFNAGGSHEESPLGGIPQGQAPDGGMNLVEQGETKLNADNYIFSKTLKIDSETAKQFNLKPTFVGKDFAEASKIANRKDSRRENDTIEEAAIQRDLDNLMNAQEAFKQKLVEEKLAEIQSLDPNALAQIAQSYQPQGMPPQGMEQGMGQEQMPQGQPSPEEMAMMQQQQGQGQGQPPMDPAMMQQMMAQQQGAPQMPMQYGGPMSYKCGGGMYEYGGDLSRQFYDGGTMSGSNFGNGYATLNNPYAQNNGLNGPANNGLNTQGFGSPGVSEQAPEAMENPAAGLTGNQYAQIGSALVGGATQTYNNFNDPNASIRTKSESLDGAVQGVAGAINPIVGTAIAAGNMIGKPIRTSLEKTDEQGNLENKSGAQAGAIVGSFFDPVKAIMTRSSYKGGWTDFSGKGYVNALEAEAKKNIADQKAAEESYNTQQLALQKQQQDAINSAIQAGIAGAQKQDDSNSNFAKYGGHQFPMLTPRYKDNAGPMGQDLGNLYADGGILDGPGDPPKAAATTIAPDITTPPIAPVITPPKYSAPPIATYNPTLSSTYGKEYAQNLKQFTDNPIDPKTGAPYQGSGGGDAGSPTGTGGDYHPLTPAQRAAAIKDLEGYGTADLRPDILERYLSLKNDKPYFVNEYGDKFLSKPYDLRDYKTPSEESLASMYPYMPPSSASSTPPPHLYLSANTGQPVYDINAAGQKEARVMPTGSLGPRQYANYLEEAANSPEAIAQRADVDARSNANIQRFATEGTPAKETPQQQNIREKAEFQAKNQQYARELKMKRQGTPNQYAMGGNMNHYFDGISGPSQMETTGGMNDENYDWTADYNRRMSQAANTPPTFTSDFPSMYQGNTGLTTGIEGNPSAEYFAQRAQAAQAAQGLNTPIEGFKTDQDKTNIKSEHKEGLGDFAANMAPIAYNAYQGWLAKNMALPENMAYHYDPYLQNINSQLRDADKMGAQAYASLRNMGNPGAIAANLGNITHELALAKAKIREAKENADNLSKTEAAKYNDKSLKDAKLMKYQLEAQMKNAREESRKESLKGIQDYINNKTANEIAGDYNAMAGEGNYSYKNVPYLQGLQRTFAASQAAKDKKKEDNKTV